MPFIPTFTQTVIPSNIRAFAPLVRHNNTNNVTLFIDNTFKLGVLNTGASPSISYDNTNKYFDLFSGNTTTYLLSAMTNLRPTPTPTPTPSRPPFLPYNLDLYGDMYSINLRSIYQQRSGDTSNTPVTVVFRAMAGARVGSTSTSLPAVNTGTWPIGSEVWFWTMPGAYVVGRGGDHGAGNTAGGCGKDGCCTACCSPGCNTGEGCGTYGFGHSFRKAGYPGGPCITLNYDLNIINEGTMGGGGGGSTSEGGYSWSLFFCYPGGGGAGFPGGYGKGENSMYCKQFARNPSLTTGSNGMGNSRGGDLGQYGTSANVNPRLNQCSSYAGGAPGNSIIQNGHKFNLYVNSIAGPLG